MATAGFQLRTPDTGDIDYMIFGILHDYLNTSYTLRHISIIKKIHDFLSLTQSKEGADQGLRRRLGNHTKARCDSARVERIGML